MKSTPEQRKEVWIIRLRSMPILVDRIRILSKQDRLGADLMRRVISPVSLVQA
jgi:hypothetical protein